MLLQQAQFIQNMDLRILYLQDVLSNFRDNEVAIYEAGVHTGWLLKMLESERNKFSMILDHDPDVIGTTQFGLPVHTLEDALHRGIKAIIISSTNEALIYHHIKLVAELGVMVIRLYSGEAQEIGEILKLNRLHNLVDDHNIYQFVDRRKNSKKVLVILAGYKSYLWPYTLERVARYAPSDLDICLCSSGIYSAELDKMAENRQWSYLHTTVNEVALIQNIAILNHPEAEWIYKLDEDIFITENYFNKLLDGYLHIQEEGLYDPGFVAPLLNVNGYSHVEFLKIIGKGAEYKERFGEFKHAANRIKCHHDGQAAKWIWEQSLPLDKVSNEVSANGFSYTVIPHRFSIGAILLRRELWSNLGGFKMAPREGVMGLDEEDLCHKCVEQSKVMCSIQNILCGHFSFYPQEATMKEFLLNNEELFK
ncbi:hypothetical protein H7B90_12500 [Cohnella xylanilytica]|uniref:Uncharacterized protein n=1 Tax=Cohnella xylanilytica TaxID=557555 RepID=A0A841U1I5_9BACL|nr:hypothetical protein [Cohnella xylanilytica]MBB6692223.1 hypothetical protein [Cohnella xylanilytica]